MSHCITNQASDDMSQSMSHCITNQASDNMSQSMSHCITNQASDDMSQSMSHCITNQASDEIAAEVQDTQFAEWRERQRQLLQWIVTQFQHFQLTQPATSLINSIKSARLHMTVRHNIISTYE